MLHRLFSSCGEQALLSRCGVWASHRSGFSCCGAQALGQVGSVLAAPRLQSTGSVVVAHGLHCFVACWIFPDQGLNPCLLHWQTDSLFLSPQGSPFSSCLDPAIWSCSYRASCSCHSCLKADCVWWSLSSKVQRMLRSVISWRSEGWQRKTWLTGNSLAFLDIHIKIRSQKDSSVCHSNKSISSSEVGPCKVISCPHSSACAWPPSCRLHVQCPMQLQIQAHELPKCHLDSMLVTWSPGLVLPQGSHGLGRGSSPPPQGWCLVWGMYGEAATAWIHQCSWRRFVSCHGATKGKIIKSRKERSPEWVKEIIRASRALHGSCSLCFSRVWPVPQHPEEWGWGQVNHSHCLQPDPWLLVPFSGALYPPSKGRWALGS